MTVSITLLRALPIFDTLDDARLQPIAQIAALRRAARGSVVLREGDRTDNIYFVVNGGLKVLVSDDEGREVILCMLGPGELFGEMGVLDDHLRSATVVATQNSDLVTIAKSDFQLCLSANFDVSLFIMRGLAQRLREADRKIESLALMDVYGRVARLLLDLAEDQDGRKVVAKKLTKQDIAKMIGASREMVSRVMKDLQQQGLIDEVDGRFVLNAELSP
ncbi:MAG: cyclic nucleotide-binding domain-containing protein [Rhodocyclaceae bacterium]|jgi:CRP/FNR family cyclic AMP-dependent transcriptional regulator|nr:cyclic nucleotide-binding domain-containing protein [Rhodocyclaceae bacterium]